MKIESTDQDIRTLLSSGYYKIPRFQRPYSWDRENIQDFWDDIIKEKSSDYFIGSMVVYKDGNQRYGVVDGQQRLTTITILMCVLRNALGKINLNDLAKGLHGLIERRNIENKEEYILTTESSYPFFQDHIQKWGEPDGLVTPLKEERNLRSAYDQFNNLVGGVVSSAKMDSSATEKEQLEQIQKKLIGIRDSLLNLKLIFVRLDHEDDAYIIFETLNTRGKDLALADLVKNHLTKHLKSKSASIDPTKIKWEKILETIEGSSVDLNTDAFIHHFWLSRSEYLPAKKLFKALRKQVIKSHAETFLDALVSDASVYRSIHETPYGKWSKQERRISEALDALQLFRVQQQTPCVLSLVREYKNKKIKMKHLQGALVAIEKFHFLFTAVTSQRSSGGISQMYAALGRRLFEAEDTKNSVDIIKELKQKMRERIPSRSEVEALFPEIIYTDAISKQRKLIKYILVALDKDNGAGGGLDYDTMTIEHIVPQSEIGVGGWSDHVVGQVGNMLLLPESLNNKLGDKTFSEKKNILLSEGYNIPEEVAAADNWSEGDIEQRTNKLAGIAYDKVWKI